MKYFKQRMALLCLLISVLQFLPDKHAETSKHRNRWASPSMWRRGTSNPAVFSRVRLSRAAERRRQTKPQSHADANESHQTAPAAVPVPRWVIVRSLPLVNLPRSSLSAMHKLFLKMQADLRSVYDVLGMKRLDAKLSYGGESLHIREFAKINVFKIAGILKSWIYIGVGSIHFSH